MLQNVPLSVGPEYKSIFGLENKTTRRGSSVFFSKFSWDAACLEKASAGFYISEKCGRFSYHHFSNKDRGIASLGVAHPSSQEKTQQTQNICITFVQRRPNVFDVGPTLYKCYTQDMCLLSGGGE